MKRRTKVPRSPVGQYSALPRYSPFPTYPHESSRVAPFSALFALPHLPSFPRITIVQPFPLCAVLWPLLTSRGSLLLLALIFVSPPIREISPGKNDNFPLIYLPHLHHGIRAVLDFALSCKLVRPANALYAISVRQTEGLPPASFRFRLATDTLAFG